MKFIGKYLLQTPYTHWYVLMWSRFTSFCNFVAQNNQRCTYHVGWHHMILRCQLNGWITIGSGNWSGCTMYMNTIFSLSYGQIVSDISGPQICTWLILFLLVTSIHTVHLIWQGPDQNVQFSACALIWGYHKTGEEWSQQNFEIFLFLNRIVHNLLNNFLKKQFHRCGEKHVPILCLWFGVFFQKFYFPFLHLKGSHKSLGNLYKYP